jgi:hypothetical protein
MLDCEAGEDFETNPSSLATSLSSIEILARVMPPPAFGEVVVRLDFAFPMSAFLEDSHHDFVEFLHLRLESKQCHFSRVEKLVLVGQWSVTERFEQFE